jgi:hypothetical protein
MRRNDRDAGRRRGIAAWVGLVVLACTSAPTRAQTYGLATMQPGTLAHATGSAIAKVLKEKGGLNTLVMTGQFTLRAHVPIVFSIGDAILDQYLMMELGEWEPT